MTCFQNAREGRIVAWTKNETREVFEKRKTWRRTEKMRNPKNFISMQGSG